ncbi:bifunctional metallophosphatase/5'-nucleotidase [Polycladomyces subterraneus]|uniref:5'-nucleotidase C-terminal domain-containing protein n=1 Tax=Polycladomyces subterraneus TaxID=1016997 RepID=A0ABT8INU4_9BACL|nr:5'-nucleotidase C-terminal domain-containing protein [Polycladomyces subterraneus]MDN4594047.1 5'-nucleotidase C-terminal domain-containing protein [Polycladomyces subterraneus]
MEKRGFRVQRWTKSLLACAVLTCAPLLTAADLSPAAHPQPFMNVQLLGINDFHGQLDVTRNVNGKPVGRGDVLAAYLREREAQNPNTLLVHAGDMAGASAPVSALMQDEPTIEMLNKLKFDVGTVGNHEFDEGVNEMMRLIYGGYHEKTGYFEGADFPYICANVVDEKTKRPILPPSLIKRVNGIPIGFIGVVTKTTPTIVTPSGVKGVLFTDEAEAINREAAKLKKRGVHAIVVLAHEGGVQDAKTGQITGPIADIANKVDDDVDVIFAGHSHSYLNGTVDGKLIVQAYSYGTAFSDVDIVIDKRTKDIVAKKGEIITTNQANVQPDPEIRDLIQYYEEKVAPIVNQKIGTAAQTLSNEENTAGESALGNLIADAQRWKMGTDFALMNPGGIRADIDAGDVTWGELYNVQPFSNDLVKMTMTGDQLKRVLEQQWQGDRAKILQISGFTYTWDPSRPVGDRITNLKKADGTPITPDGRYTVTANSFLAGGGDGFTVFQEPTDKVVGPVDLDALIEYIKQLPQPFSAQIEGRIQLAGQ